jgi:hypothetical protein
MIDFFIFLKDLITIAYFRLVGFPGGFFPLVIVLKLLLSFVDTFNQLAVS